MALSAWSSFNLVASPFNPNPIGSDPVLPPNLLVGRDREIEEFTESVQMRQRITQVIGPPGAGITSMVNAGKLRLSGKSPPVETPVPLVTLLDYPSPWDFQAKGLVVTHVDCRRTGSWDRAGILAERLERLVAEIPSKCEWHLVLDGVTQALGVSISRRSTLRDLRGNATFVWPLPSEQVLDVLHRRYEVLRLDPSSPIHPPVDDESVLRLYHHTGENLRRLLDVLSHATRAWDQHSLKPDTRLDWPALNRFLHRRRQS